MPCTRIFASFKQLFHNLKLGLFDHCAGGYHGESHHSALTLNSFVVNNLKDNDAATALVHALEQLLSIPPGVQNGDVWSVAIGSVLMSQ